MARKQFVSSKKNAPSRVVSSKEAALQGRNPAHADDDDDDDVDSDGSLNGGDSPDSPMSSAPSSPISSDDEGDNDVEEDGGEADPADADDGVEDDATAVALQVVPASVGRGKQLRFPTAISRGKEARILHNGSDRDNSDSESYASVASDEEEDTASGGEEDSQIIVTSSQSTDAGADVASASTTTIPTIDSSPSRSATVAAEEEEDIDYPIKAFRARKRHRPDSGYITQMSIYVRDCLLSVRDVANADLFRDDAHDEFRRKLSAGTVERVQWKEAPTSPPAATPPDSEKPVPKSSPRESSEKSEKPPKESKMDRPASSSSKSSSRKSDRKESKEDKSGDRESSSRKRERNGKEKESRGSSRGEADKKESSTKATKSSSSSKGEAGVHENGKSKSKSDAVKQEDVLCAQCKKSVSEQNANEEESRKLATPAGTPAPSPPPAQVTPVVRAPVSIVEPVPVGTFLFPAPTGRDIAQMREEATRLHEQARALKHEGNRRGEADPKPAGQVDQGRYFLKACAKFFQQALLFADLKTAYREIRDEPHARMYGDSSMQTLRETYLLIESAIRTLHAAGDRRMYAIGYKFASIVKLTLYRLQHVKLLAFYSKLFTPGRSPDSRQNGTTPPLSGSSTDSQDAAVKALLLKEMEHTLRGFEMWQRYEACRVEVLPRITNPVVLDMGVLFEDLETELSRS